jgi:putative Mn2+ efflux pump MntP
MGGYGLYLLPCSVRSSAPEELDYPWALFGTPLSLSVDNLTAGTSLGMLGVSPWLAAVIFAAVTAVLSFISLSIGRAVGHLIPIRADLLSAIALIVVAVVLVLSSRGRISPAQHAPQFVALAPSMLKSR